MSFPTAATAAAAIWLLAAAPVEGVVYTALANPFDLQTNTPTCSSTQYFDTSSLQCLACAAEGQTLEPSGSGLSCKCINGVVESNGDGLGVCTLCGGNEAPSSDGTTCMPCGNSTLGLDGGECRCPEGQALFETNGHGTLLAAKECGSCGQTAYLNSATRRCTPCPTRYQTATSVGCVCMDGYKERLHADGLWATGLGGGSVSCVQEQAYSSVQQYDTASANSLTLADLVDSGGSLTIVSKAFEQLLIPAATECLRAVLASRTADEDAAPKAQPVEVGNAACNAVANLCVAQLYSANTPACAVFSFLQSQSTLKSYSTPASLRCNGTRLTALLQDAAPNASGSARPASPSGQGRQESPGSLATQRLNTHPVCPAVGTNACHGLSTTRRK